MPDRFPLTGKLQGRLRKAAEDAERTGDNAVPVPLLIEAAEMLAEVERRLDALWQQTRWDDD